MKEEKTKKTKTEKTINIEQKIAKLRRARGSRRPIILEKIVEKEPEEKEEKEDKKPKKSILPKILISVIAAGIIYMIMRPKNERI